MEPEYFKLEPEPPLSPAAFDERLRMVFSPLAGVDEAGRGPLAGPVVAAAVILPPGADYPGVGDSKKLSPRAREKAFALITERALAWAWAEVSAAEVDRLNPLGAALAAMARALGDLSLRPALALIDGPFVPPGPVQARAVVRGDARSLSIGAASILAKETRDRLMLEWHERCPQYGFDRHKGYGSAEHLAALRLHGPSPCHRLSFRGVLPPAGLDFPDSSPASPEPE